MSGDIDNLAVSRSEKQPRRPGFRGICGAGAAAGEADDDWPQANAAALSEQIAQQSQRAFYGFIAIELLLGILIVLAMHFGRDF